MDDSGLHKTIKIKAVQEPRWIDEPVERKWQSVRYLRGQHRRIPLQRNDAFKKAKAARAGFL